MAKKNYDEEYYHSHLVEHKYLFNNGSYSERILWFYRLHGPTEAQQRDPDGYFRVMYPKGLAKLIGHKDPQTVSNMLGQLIRQNKLKKVYNFKGDKHSYQAIEKVEDLSDERLEELEPFTYPNQICCNLSDTAELKGRNITYKDLPDVPIAWFNGVAGKALSGLLDWDRPGVHEFWNKKLINAITTKGHPLAEIKDINERKAAAIHALIMGVQKQYTEKNPDWKPKSVIGFALKALSVYLKTDAKWAVIPEQGKVFEGPYIYDDLQEHLEGIRESEQKVVILQQKKSSELADPEEKQEKRSVNNL